MHLRKLRSEGSLLHSFIKYDKSHYFGPQTEAPHCSSLHFLLCYAEKDSDQSKNKLVTPWVREYVNRTPKSPLVLSQMDLNMPVMVLPDTIWYFQVLN